MRTKHPLNIAISLSLICITLFEGNAQTRGDGPNESLERIAAPLVNAGITINEPSLIKALSNEDKRIATSAASVLSTFPKTKSIVRALNSVVKDEDEILAVTVMSSLLTMKETGWVTAGVKRLPSMHDPVERIQLAGLLAQAGNTEGWPIIVSSIEDGKYSMTALDNVSYFDGKKLQNGAYISVVDELERLQITAPASSRELIQAKLKQLKSKER
ncbi:MAG: hypothetical protein ACHQKY_18050 [Terriglobia bacterium]